MENTTLLIDPETHDLVIDDDGSFAMINGDETTAQCVRLTLEVYEGEWFLDERHGVDYPRVFGDPPSEDAVTKDIVRAAIFQETDVKHIDTLDVKRNPASRRLDVGFTGRLQSGRSISMEVKNGERMGVDGEGL